MDAIEIWFAIDERTSFCGFVSAATAVLESASDCRLRIMAAYEKGKASPVTWWKDKLLRLGKPFEIHPIEVDLSRYAHCKGVFDSKVAFLRLEIPNLSSEEILIYSDADVVFQESVKNLVQEISSNTKSISLVQSGVCSAQPAREQNLLSNCGRKLDEAYFFSGLAVIRPKNYKLDGIPAKVSDIISNHAPRLDFHDQTVWNCALSTSEVGIIDSRWCHAAFPGALIKKSCNSGGILHFVGSPKPWDLFAEFFHPFARDWISASKKTGIGNYNIKKYYDLNSWTRAARIRKQYSCWLRF